MCSGAEWGELELQDAVCEEVGRIVYDVEASDVRSCLWVGYDVIPPGPGACLRYKTCAFVVCVRSEPCAMGPNVDPSRSGGHTV